MVAGHEPGSMSTARVWDARTGKPVTGPLEHRGQGSSVQPRRRVRGHRQ